MEAKNVSCCSSFNTANSRSARMEHFRVDAIGSAASPQHRWAQRKESAEQDIVGEGWSPQYMHVSEQDVQRKCTKYILQLYCTHYFNYVSDSEVIPRSRLLLALHYVPKLCSLWDCRTVPSVALYRLGQPWQRTEQIPMTWWIAISRREA